MIKDATHSCVRDMSVHTLSLTHTESENERKKRQTDGGRANVPGNPWKPSHPPLV